MSLVIRVYAGGGSVDSPFVKCKDFGRISAEFVSSCPLREEFIAVFEVGTSLFLEKSSSINLYSHASFPSYKIFFRILISEQDFRVLLYLGGGPTFLEVRIPRRCPINVYYNMILPPHIKSCWSSGIYSTRLLFVRNLIFLTPAAGNHPLMIFHAAIRIFKNCIRNNVKKLNVDG